MIYLDYAASSPPFPEVLRKTSELSQRCFGNPGALHRGGTEARKILQESRFLLAQLTNVRPEEIFFTSGGTEANNWAVSSAAARKHILCSAAEHSSVLAAAAQLQKKGYEVTYLNPDQEGRILPEAVEKALHPDTGLLCVQAVNNETGVIQDVEALADLAHQKGVRYFCDGVQSFGQVARKLCKADLISLSAHKLGGPRGVGCLIVRQPHVIDPMIVGGGQEFGMRSGTENLPAIAGFALAAQLSARELSQGQHPATELTRLLERELRRIVPGLRIAGENAPRSHILSCAFPGISAEEMVVRLDLRGICASPGAACAAGSGKPSHVLRSMGYSPQEAAEFVRFSPGRSTTADEILETVSAVADILKKRN